MQKHWTHFLLVLIFVVLAGIFVRVVALGPPDELVRMESMEPRYVQGFAADGSTAAGNPVQVAGKDSGGLAQSLRTDTEGRPIVQSFGTTTMTLDGEAVTVGDITTGTVAVDDGGNVLSVDDAGASLTVDGSVVVSDITTGTVTVDDGAGSLTVDQATHDLLQANVTVQQGDVDVAIGNPLYITPTQRLEVDATTSGDVPITLDSEVVAAQPFQAIAETGLTEIIGADEQIAQYDWSDGTEIVLGGSYSEELLNYTVVMSGAINQAWTLLVFDADPGVTAGDANLATASWDLVVAKIDGAAGDWFCENSGGTGCVATFEIPHAVHSLSSVWVAIYWEGATTLNDGAADDEVISVNIWYRRDS